MSEFKTTILHDPDDDGVWVNGPAGDVYTPYSEDSYDGGITKEDALSTIGLQKKPVWQPSMPPEEFAMLVGKPQIARPSKT